MVWTDAWPSSRLDLLKFGPGCSAEFRAGAASVVGRDPRDTGRFGVWPEHLPDYLLRQHLALHLVAAMHGPEHVAGHNTGGAGPGVNGHLGPRRHRHGPHAVVLAHEVHNAPPTIPLLYVADRKRCHLRPPQPATQQHGDYGAVTQPLGRRDIRNVEKRLCLLQRQPVPHPHADRLRALHALDAGGQLRRQQPVVGRLHRQLADRGHADDY